MSEDRHSHQPATSDLFGVRKGVVNLGLEGFADSTRAQGVATVHLQWKPPAGGDERLARLLAALR